MSKRFRRQALRDARIMASEGYPGRVDKWGKVTIPIRRRQRWRWTVRGWAKAQGWCFVDVWLFMRYRGVGGWET
jgi:hypothetical protein